MNALAVPFSSENYVSSFQTYSLVTRLVYIQEKYEVPSEEDLRNVVPFPLGNEEGNHTIRFRHLAEISKLTTGLIRQFVNEIPYIRRISEKYRESLTKASVGEVMMLRSARRYHPGTDSIVFANNQPFTRENFRSACIGEFTDYMFDFCRMMYGMRINNAVYALLTVIIILSKRPYLFEEEPVKHLRDFYIEALRRYSASSRLISKPLFDKWLYFMRRKLHHLGIMKSENSFSLMVRNKKLHPLLEDIWDILICYPRYECLKSSQTRRLSDKQNQFIYKLAVVQDAFEFPTEEDLKSVTPFALGCSEEDHLKRIQHMTDITNLTVQLIVETAKRTPGFNLICREDQVILLKACFSEVIVLRLARRYDPKTDSIVFANNQPYTKENFSSAFTEEFSETLLNFCRTMYQLKVNNGEYALLSAILLFTVRPALQEPKKVEMRRNIFMEILLAHIATNRPGSGDSFNKLLLSRLFILHKLGSLNLEQYLSFKMRKNIKINPFLKEFLNHQE